MNKKLSLYPILKRYIYIHISKGRYVISNFRDEDAYLADQKEFIFLSLCDGSLTLGEIAKIYGGIFMEPIENATARVQELMTKHSQEICLQNEMQTGRKILREGNYKRQFEKWKYSKLRDETPGKLTIVLTEGCNHTCDYCFKSCNYERKKEVDLEKWRDVIEQAGEIGVQQITFSGGEPFLYKGLLSLIELCSAKGIYTKISTNGTYLGEDAIRKLHDAGAEYIHLSLPAVTDSLYDMVTGSRGDLERVKAAVRLLKRYGFYIRVKMVLTPNNVDEVEQLIDYCAHENVDFIHLAPFILTTSSREGKALIPAEESLVRIKDLCSRKKEEYKIISIGEPPIGSLKWSGPQDISKCGGIKDRLTILSNGDITFCEALADKSEFILGNVYDDSLKEIWNSDKPDKVTSIENRNLDRYCRECEYLDKCQTGCFVFSNIQSGDPWAIDPRCWKFSGSYNIFS